MPWWDDLLASEQKAKQLREGLMTRYKTQQGLATTTPTPATFTGQVGGMTKAATPPTTFAETLGTQLRGAGYTPQQLTPRAGAGQPTYQPQKAALGAPAVTGEPANWWQKVTPWKEEEGETFLGEVKERLPWGTPKTPTPTFGGEGLAQPSAPGQVLPTEATGYPPGWKEMGEQWKAEPWTSLRSPTEEQRTGGSVMDFPQIIQWLRNQGYSQEEIGGMTVGQAEDIEDAYGQQQALEQGKQQAEVSRGVWATPEQEAQRQQVYEESQARGREGYWTPEQMAHRQRQAGEQAARGREQWGTPEAQAQRQRAYEESQARQQEHYWSPEQVADREKVREESRESAKAHELRGWDTYFDLLDDLQLSPDANEYWDDPARLRELRDKWEAGGKKGAWMTYLKNYDMKGEFASKTYRERMGTAARMAPRMRTASY